MLQSIKEIMTECLEEFKYPNKNNYGWSGFKNVDKYLCGVPKGSVIMVSCSDKNIKNLFFKKWTIEGFNSQYKIYNDIESVDVQCHKDNNKLEKIERYLKQLAMSQNIIVICGYQNIQKRLWDAPDIQIDLRESNNSNIINGAVIKNRHGLIGKFKLFYNKDKMQIEDLEE